MGIVKVPEEDGIIVFDNIVLPINDTRSTLNFSKLLWTSKLMTKLELKGFGYTLFKSKEFISSLLLKIWREVLE